MLSGEIALKNNHHYYYLLNKVNKRPLRTPNFSVGGKVDVSFSGHRQRVQSVILALLSTMSARLVTLTPFLTANTRSTLDPAQAWN